MSSTNVSQKKMGRPSVGSSSEGISPRVGIRIEPEAIAEIDRKADEWKVNRSEAIRRLITIALNDETGADQ